MGVPVRLITRKGVPIALDAVGFTMGVRKGIPAIPVPVTGERFGTDMNLVSCDIRIEAILRDDDCSSTTSEPQAASAFIDFGRVHTVNSNSSEAVNELFMAGDGSGGRYAADDIHGKSFSLRSTHQKASTSDVITVVFDSSTGSHSSTASPPTTTVGTAGLSKGSQFATAVHAALTAANYAPTVITAAGGTQFTDAFTISITAGQLTTLAGGLNNTKVVITQKEKGNDGNTDTPEFWTDNGGSRASPTHQQFRDGADHTCKSAGDKMQDLIANVANSNIAGSMGAVMNLGGSTDGGGLDVDLNVAPNAAGDDYIIGLQLPYNSLQQVGTAALASSDPPNYATRNFLIVTGLTNPEDQNSKGNTLDASVEFDQKDLKTGIRGTVTDVSFKYSAGETVYSADITFQPLDMIVGL